jgi:hypothetical protein
MQKPLKRMTPDRAFDGTRRASMPPVLRLLLRDFIWRMLVIVGGASVTVAQATASLNWTWNYSAAGVVANGTFTTGDNRDAAGFFLITSISGMRNGDPITGLQQTGTAIPGNEPFAVDNLVRPDGPQLTHNGFGYAIAGGTYANPFFADFASPAGYLEFFSAPPFTAPANMELPIVFAATLTTVPEPPIWTLFFIGLGLLNGVRSRLAVTRAVN